MRFLKNEETSQIICLGEWTIRSRGTKVWKVTGPKGSFTLHEKGAMRWRYIFGNPRDGSQRRESFDAKSVQEAAEKSLRILFHEPPSDIVKAPSMSIADVFAACLKTCGGEPYHKSTLAKHAGYFISWCRKRKIKAWHEVLPQHIAEYAAHQLGRGCCRKTTLHYLEPIRLASRWAAMNHPNTYRNIFEGFRLPAKAGKVLRYAQRKQRAYLPINMIVEWLDWLSSHRYAGSLRVGVSLQGLSGLQMQEALRLTWDRVDLNNGTLVIEEDRRNNPDEVGVKNQHRVRCLPLPRLTLEILKEAYASNPPRSGSDLVIHVPSWKAYSHRVARSMRAWNPSVQIPPKDLRNTLPTEAERGGWMSVWVRRYLGHAPATMIESAYLSEVSVSEDPDAGIQKLRDKVVYHVDLEVENCKMLHGSMSVNVDCSDNMGIIANLETASNPVAPTILNL